MPDALCTFGVIRFEPLTHRQVSDRYFYLSRRWMENLVSRPYQKLVDNEQLANETVLRLIQWMSKQSESSPLLFCDLDRVCRTIARRVAIQAIRDARRCKRCEAVLDTSLDDYVGDICMKCEEDPQQIAMHSEIVQNIFKSLDLAEATLLELRFKGWTNLEIANHIGSTKRQVQSKFNSIKSKLSGRLLLGHWAINGKRQTDRLRTQDSGLRTQDSGLRTQDSGLRTQDSGLRTRTGDLGTRDS